MWVACNQGYPQEDCEVEFTGTKVGGGKLVKNVVYPKLDSGKGFAMMKVGFSGWEGLRQVESTKAEIAGHQDTLGVVVDDLEYTVEGCRK